MHLLPWEYGVRNLWRRPLRTLLTALGLTLVVFLLLLVLSFVRGLETTLSTSGDPDVVIIHSVMAEDNLENSAIADSVPTLVKAELAEVVVSHGPNQAVSPEFLVSSVIGEGGDDRHPSLAVIRGVRPEVFLVRRRAFLEAGTFPQTGEVLVGRLAATKIGIDPAQLAIGQTLNIEGQPRRISGRFAAPGTFLEAEIWCPLDDLKLQMRRPNDLSIVAVLLRPAADRKEQLGEIDYFCRFRRADLELRGSPESAYYDTLRKHYEPLRLMAWLLVALVGLAGGCGAINTMYAAVAGRVREFAALQTLGFPRRALILSLLQESVLLAALATLTATLLALLLLQGLAIRFTMGAFALHLDPLAILVGCGVGLAVGVLGALPPAVRALRIEVAAALKAI